MGYISGIRRYGYGKEPFRRGVPNGTPGVGMLFQGEYKIRPYNAVLISGIDTRRCFG